MGCDDLSATEEARRESHNKTLIKFVSLGFSPCGKGFPPLMYCNICGKVFVRIVEFAEKHHEEHS